MKYFVAVSLLCLAAYSAAFDTSLNAHWEVYKMWFVKKYDSLEVEEFRRSVFEQKVRHIELHNLKHDLGLETYRLGLNQFSDWTFEEYLRFNNGARPTNKTHGQLGTWHLNKMALPDTVDWREKGYVTGVKNQRQCGSCWAFASTGAIEGANMATNGKLVSLSEQNLVDCVDNNNGCGGGWMDNAFTYVAKNGGIDSEASYPYTAKNGNCSFSTNGVAVKVSSHVDVPRIEVALQNAIAFTGPVAVAIDAAHESFMSYKGGLYSEPSCKPNSPDHAVLVVGYGSEDGFDYWIVKNSWGTSWGEQGYIRMLRNNNNMCGIANYASYPVV